MPKTLREQIESNSRWSFFCAFLLVLLLGALGGAVGGYYLGDFLLASIGSIVVGIVAAMVAWFKGSSIVLKFSNAREATPLELSRLNNVTEEMAIAAGIPKPAVYLVDDPTPNAFATGDRPAKGVVVVTTGLMDRLNREELQGVVAHEVAHIRNNDIRLMTTLAIVAGLIPMISEFFLRSLWYTGGRSRRSSEGGGQAQLIMLVVAIALAILAPIFAKLLELAVSRKREYMADATAAELTRNPSGLASALEAITRDAGKMKAKNKAIEHMYIVNPFKPLQKAKGLFSTHPPSEERIRRLNSMAGLRGDTPTSLPD